MSFRLPELMGHRGAAGSAPENTLVGIRRAAAEGARWVEVDVMLTGDDQPVLYHDDKLARTTGREGVMAETPMTVLAGLEAGSWFDASFAGEPIPSLEQAIDLIQELGLRLNLEIKPSKGRKIETAEEVMRRLAAVWPANAEPPLISSFEQDCLRVARDSRPEWPRAFISLKVNRNWRKILAELGCQAFHVYWKRTGRSQVKAVKEAGYGFACFTVNDPAIAAKLWGWGVDCMITDYPGRILAAREVA